MALMQSLVDADVKGPHRGLTWSDRIITLIAYLIMPLIVFYAFPWLALVWAVLGLIMMVPVCLFLPIVPVTVGVEGLMLGYYLCTCLGFFLIGRKRGGWF